MPDLEDFENEGGNLGAGASGGAPGGGPEPAVQGVAGNEWTGPSREEWNSLQESNKRLQESLEGLTEVFNTPTPEPQRGGEFDLSQLDMTDPYQVAWLADQIAAERMNSVAPYVKNAAQDQGQRQMGELLIQHESALKKDFPDGFDKKLAERAAFAFFDETGDAEGSVEMAARYAAEVRKEERNAAIESYRTKNARGGIFDFSAEGKGGTRVPEPLKTYDEVIDKWASQSEV